MDGGAKSGRSVGAAFFRGSAPGLGSAGQFPPTAWAMCFLNVNLLPGPEYLGLPPLCWPWAVVVQLAWALMP